MEEVLTVYHRPYDPKYPVICEDEAAKQLVAESRPPMPARPGDLAKYDFEYVRNGVADLFIFTEPLAGWRRLAVTDRRTKIDWAKEVQRLVEEDYPDAVRITLVCDNLNIHTPGALYEAFEPEVARRILDRLEIIHTPKHGSWLNIAEIELSILSRQCLAARIPDKATLTKAVTAWYTWRNAENRQVNWQFTTADARIKLKHLYPSYTA